jgi:hypothetical protein
MDGWKRKERRNAEGEKNRERKGKKYFKKLYFRDS